MAPKSYSPMTRRPYRIETVLGHQSFGRRPGEVGHPARKPPAMLGQIRRTHANNPPDTSFRGVAGHYPQAPAPHGGSMVPRWPGLARVN